MKFKKLLKFAIPALGLAAIAVSLPVALTSCGDTTSLNKKPSDKPTQTIPTTNQQDITNTTKVLEGLAPNAKTGYLAASDIRSNLLSNLKVANKDVAQMNVVITKADSQSAKPKTRSANFWANYASDAGSIPTDQPSGGKKPGSSSGTTGDTSKPDTGSKPEGKPSTDQPTKPQLKTLTTNISLTLNKNAAWPKDLSKDTSSSFIVNGQTLTLKDVKLTASAISINSNVISSDQIQQVIDQFSGLGQLTNLDINTFDNYLSAINPQFIPGSINSVSVVKNSPASTPSTKPQTQPTDKPTSRAVAGTNSATAPTNTNVSLTVTLTPSDNFVYLNSKQQVEKTLVFNDITYSQQDLALSLANQQAMQAAIESILGKTWTKDTSTDTINAKQQAVLTALNQLACLKSTPVQSVQITLNDVLSTDHPNQTANVTLTFKKKTNIELNNPEQDLFRYPNPNVTNTLTLVTPITTGLTADKLEFIDYNVLLATYDLIQNQLQKGLQQSHPTSGTGKTINLAKLVSELRQSSRYVGSNDLPPLAKEQPQLANVLQANVADIAKQLNIPTSCIQCFMVYSYQCRSCHQEVIKYGVKIQFHNFVKVINDNNNIDIANTGFTLDFFNYDLRPLN